MRDTAARIVEAFARPIKAAIPGRQRRQMALRDAYRRVFDSEDGRMILADLVRLTGTGDCLVAGDPYTTHYNLGAYRVLRHIQAQGHVSDRAILMAITDTAEADRRANEGDDL